MRHPELGKRRENAVTISRSGFAYKFTCLFHAQRHGLQRSIQHAKTQRVWHRADRIEQRRRVIAIDIGDHVADLGIGFQVLAEDVGAVRAQRLVDACQHARLVGVQMHEAMRLFQRRRPCCCPR